MSNAVGKDTCLTHDKLWRCKTQNLANKCMDIIPTRLRKRFTYMACICDDKKGVDEFKREWGKVGYLDLCSAFRDMECFIEKKTPDTLLSVKYERQRSGTQSICSHIDYFIGDLEKNEQLDALKDDTCNKPFPKSALKLIYMLKQWIETGLLELKGVSKKQLKELIGDQGKHIQKFAQPNKCSINLILHEGKVFAKVSKKGVKLSIKGAGHSGDVCDASRGAEQVHLVQLRKLGADYVKYVQDQLGGTSTLSTTHDVQQKSGIRVEHGDNRVPTKDAADAVTAYNMPVETTVEDDNIVPKHVPIIQAECHANQRKSGITVEQDENKAPSIDISATATTSNAHKLHKDVLDVIKEGRLYCLHERVDVAEPPIKDSKALQKHFHVCEKPISELDIKVAVTEIGEHSSRWKYIKDITSKICHFGIVPMLAYWQCTEQRLAQFIFPYPNKGSLAQAIQTNMLTSEERLRILYQVISAIQYLHDQKLNKRKQFLHMDVCSENIVLDSKGNARLIDLGFPHDVGDAVFIVSGQEKKTVYHDLGNFGIVIRQMLTGKPSHEQLYGNNTVKSITSEQLENNYLLKMWTDRPDDDAYKLLESSEWCIASVKEQTKDVADIKENIEEVLRNNTKERWLPTDFPDGNGGKCEVCMVNPTVGEKIQSAMESDHGGKCKFRLCAACMRKADFNPIACHSCDQIITPPIGAGWGVILIAGNTTAITEDNDHEKATKIATQFTKDVTDIQEIFTDKKKPVLSLSKEVVELVCPETPGTETNMKDKIITAFYNLETKNLKTLVLVFSGHHDDKKGFLLGNEHEYITREELCSQMKRLNKTVRKFVIFLDCCKAQSLLGDLREKDNEGNRKLIQLNACGPDEKTIVHEQHGSLFIRFIIQALTRDLENKHCLNHKLLQSECKHCEVKSPGDFIMLSGLIEYVEKHINEYCKKEKCKMFSTTKSIDNIKEGYDDIVAFNCDCRIKLKCSLHFNWKPKSTVEAVGPTRFNDIKEVKRALLRPFTDKMKVWSGLDEEFSDVLTMEVDGKEIESVHELMNAWSSDRQVRLLPRDRDMITDGRVAIRLLNAPTVYDFFFLKMTTEQREEQTKCKVVKLHCEEGTDGESDVDRMIGHLKDHVNNLEKANVPLDRKDSIAATLKSLVKILKPYNSKEIGTRLRGKTLRIIFPVQPIRQTLVRDIVCLQIV